MKYITVKLTEDQAQTLVEEMQKWVWEHDWQHTERAKKKTAFGKRLKTKLEKALAQAKSDDCTICSVTGTNSCLQHGVNIKQ